MAEASGLKTALRESNAIGWNAFFVLVIGIGVGAIMFGGGDKPLKEQAAQANSSGNGLNYLK